MRGGERPGGRALMMRIARHVVGGLLTGAVVGYLLALVLPRRYQAPPGSYQAPIPPGAGLRSGADEVGLDDQAVTLARAASAVEAG
jgi:hypothetical protein